MEVHAGDGADAAGVEVFLARMSAFRHEAAVRISALEVRLLC